MTNQFKPMQPQNRGFVLMVSLIMVIAITSIAVSLLSSASMDNKMASASEDREMAVHIARGGNDQLYYKAVNRIVDGRNYFAAFASVTDSADYESSTGALSTVSWATETPRTATDCPRSKRPTDSLQCIHLQTNSIKTFGPGNSNQINVVSGVAQQVGVK